jgi:hypothetical protein
VVPPQPSRQAATAGRAPELGALQVPWEARVGVAAP